MSLPPAPTWYHDAACRQLPAHEIARFWGNDTEMQRAIITCRRCPVRTDCLLHALAEREDLGVWGGKTPRQRDHLLANSHTSE